MKLKVIMAVTVGHVIARLKSIMASRSRLRSIVAHISRLYSSKAFGQMGVLRTLGHQALSLKVLRKQFSQT